MEIMPVRNNLNRVPVEGTRAIGIASDHPRAKKRVSDSNTSLPESATMDRPAVMETSILVVEIGLFPATARDLNIDQPAISRSSAQGVERSSVHPSAQDPQASLPVGMIPMRPGRLPRLDVAA
jgi:hypothetical protein